MQDLELDLLDVLMWMNVKLELTIVQMRLHVQTLQGDLPANVNLDLVEMEYSAQVNCYCQRGQLLLSYYDVFTLTGTKTDNCTDKVTKNMVENGFTHLLPISLPSH